MNAEILNCKKLIAEKVLSSLSDFERENAAEHFAIEYTHDSTAIDGNSISLIGTRLILIDGIVPAETLVAVEDGAITGFGDIDSTGYLDRLFVRKDRQGLGIASALCSRLEEGFARVLTRSSITAKPFFLNRGYKVISEMQAVRSGISLTNFLMEKTTEHRQSDD